MRQTVHLRTINLPDGHGGLMPVTCLIARECATQEDHKPIEWRLLTNRAVTTFDQAAELIDWYRCRWEIETLFHVLKNGSRVEALQDMKIVLMRGSRPGLRVICDCAQKGCPRKK